MSYVVKSSAANSSTPGNETYPRVVKTCRETMTGRFTALPASSPSPPAQPPTTGESQSETGEIVEEHVDDSHSIIVGWRFVPYNRDGSLDVSGTIELLRGISPPNYQVFNLSPKQVVPSHAWFFANRLTIREPSDSQIEPISSEDDGTWCSRTVEYGYEDYQTGAAYFTCIVDEAEVWLPKRPSLESDPPRHILSIRPPTSRSGAYPVTYFLGTLVENKELLYDSNLGVHSIEVPAMARDPSMDYNGTIVFHRLIWKGVSRRVQR